MQIFNVFPDRTTRARATNSSPSAGASKFILYSTVSTESSAAINVYAAYPQALSAIAPSRPRENTHAAASTLRETAPESPPRPAPAKPTPPPNASSAPVAQNCPAPAADIQYPAAQIQIGYSCARVYQRVKHSRQEGRSNLERVSTCQPPKWAAPCQSHHALSENAGIDIFMIYDTI